jgi:hypothetical protein
VNLINKLLGRRIPIFRQFNLEMREKIYQKARLRTFMINHSSQEEQVIDINKLKKESIVVILNGSVSLQVVKV